MDAVPGPGKILAQFLAEIRAVRVDELLQRSLIFHLLSAAGAQLRGNLQTVAQRADSYHAIFLPAFYW